MATWKKIIVSGSDAHLKSVTASNGSIFSGSVVTTGSIQVLTGDGTTSTTTGYQRIGLQIETQLSGSFTGSFYGSLLANNGVVSSSTLSSLTQGTVTSSINGVNQNVSIGVRPQDSPTFTNLTLSGDINVNGGDIITNAGTFNIATTNATTVNIGTTGANTLGFGSSTSTASFNGQVIVAGDLTVNGTTTTIDTTNLLVEDRFAFLANGTTVGVGDGGIIVNQDTTTGKAFAYEGTSNRWGFQSSVAQDATSITHEAFVGVIQESNVAPSADPIYGGSSGKGTLYVQDNGDIWIYG